jgi:glycerate kinase
VAHVLAAPDKYRGTLSASQAAAAIGEAARRAGWSADLAPVSDGGEGFLEVFSGLGQLRHSVVEGPLGEPVEAPWVLAGGPASEPGGPNGGLGGPTDGRGDEGAPAPAQAIAIVESSRANGLSLVGGAAGNDPLAASTKGVGQLIKAAIDAGAEQVLVGMGGSATTDGGLGAVEVLLAAGRPTAEIVVACDVETKFLDAARVFAPQKGASPSEVELLAARLAELARLYAERFGVDVRELAGSGAAGGLAGGLAAIGAKLVPGFELVSERLGLARRAGAADLVVTGEGYLDPQSFAGKAVGGVVALARSAGVGTLVVAGDVAPGLRLPPGLEVVSLAARFGLSRAMGETAALITEVVGEKLARARP